MLPTDPYDIERIAGDLEQRIREEGWADSELVFNLTGGTKTMVLAAYRIAESRRAPFVYLQSEGRRSILYRYEFGDHGYRKARDEVLPALLTINDYIRAHVGRDPEQMRPKEDLGARFEAAIRDALQGCVDEVKQGVILGGALELDLVVRLGNQVGVIQAKTGEKAKKKEGLDQLNAACGRENLGTYTAKILTVNQRWDETLENLRELGRGVEHYGDRAAFVYPRLPFALPGGPGAPAKGGASGPGGVGGAGGFDRVGGGRTRDEREPPDQRARLWTSGRPAERPCAVAE